MDRAAVAAIAALEDDLRRALYEYVRRAGRSVTRDEAARAVGISRNLAAFHLDKLTELGLLRSGFGDGPRRVGRAPRRYEPAPADICVRLPERTPELVAEILIDAVAGETADESARRAALRIAAERGREAGAAERSRLRGPRLGAERAVSASVAVLTGAGYEPRVSESVVRLHNCPFHPLAARAPAVVCRLNGAYLEGVLTALGALDRLVVEPAPEPGGCCVQLRLREPPLA